MTLTHAWPLIGLGVGSILILAGLAAIGWHRAGRYRDQRNAAAVALANAHATIAELRRTNRRYLRPVSPTVRLDDAYLNGLPAEVLNRAPR